MSHADPYIFYIGHITLVGNFNAEQHSLRQNMNTRILAYILLVTLKEGMSNWIPYTHTVTHRAV